LTILVFRMSCS